MLGVVPIYFDKHFNTAVSAYQCATALGITIVPLVTQWLLQLYGWRGVLVIISGIGLHTIPLSAFLRPERRSHKTERALLLQKADNGRSQTDINNDERNDRSCLSKAFDIPRSVSFLLTFLLPGFVYGYIFNGWIIYIVSYAIDIDLTLTESSIIASCGGVGVFVIRLLIPIWSKFPLSFKQILIMSSAVASMCLLLTVFIIRIELLCILSFGFGIATGALGGEFFVISKDIAYDHNYFSVISVLYAFIGIGVIFSGILTGTLL